MEQIPGMVLINRIVPAYAHRCVGLDNVSGAHDGHANADQ